MRKEARWVINDKGDLHFTSPEDCIPFTRKVRFLEILLFLLVGVLVCLVFNYRAIIDRWIVKHVKPATDEDFEAHEKGIIE